jgi:hypothetical protein
MADQGIPKFYYDPEHDTNDGKEWSVMDLEDLRITLARDGVQGSRDQPVGLVEPADEVAAGMVFPRQSHCALVKEGLPR